MTRTAGDLSIVFYLPTEESLANEDLLLFFDFFYNYNALSRFLITKLEYTDNLFLTYVLGIKFTEKKKSRNSMGLKQA